MNKTYISINVIEVASELAHDQLLIEHNHDEDSLWQLDGDTGDFIYKDEIQDDFNDWYSYFETKLYEYQSKINGN